MERRARLLGLAAPAKQEISSDGGGPLVIVRREKEEGVSNLAGIPSVSILCLRDMIAEIDVMKSLPTAEEIQEMIVRWRVVELGLHKTEEKGKKAAALINEHEIQVLLKTRKFRDAQEERRHRQRERQGWLARDYEE